MADKKLAKVKSGLTTDKITFTEEQVKLIKDTICKGATDDEFKLFMYQCQRTGLDPFAKQIYAVKRWNSTLKREEMTVQISIDGSRLTAERTGQHAGTEDAVFDTESEDHPTKATVKVHRLVSGHICSFTATARWAEYVQKTRDGKPNSFWARMPFSQLAKCAESLALRKAFPMELSGLYTTEEMQQADIDQEIINHPNKVQTVQDTATEDLPIEGEVVIDEVPEEVQRQADEFYASKQEEQDYKKVTEAQRKQIFRLLNVLYPDSEEYPNRVETMKDKLKEKYSRKSFNDLSLEEANEVIEGLLKLETEQKGKA